MVGSRTRTAGGTTSGALLNLTLFDYTGRSYGNHAEITGISPAFDAASGRLLGEEELLADLREVFPSAGRAAIGVARFPKYAGASRLAVAERDQAAVRAEAERMLGFFGLRGLGLLLVE